MRISRKVFVNTRDIDRLFWRGRSASTAHAGNPREADSATLREGERVEVGRRACFSTFADVSLGRGGDCKIKKGDDGVGKTVAGVNPKFCSFEKRWAGGLKMGGNTGSEIKLKKKRKRDTK